MEIAVSAFSDNDKGGFQLVVHINEELLTGNGEFVLQAHHNVAFVDVVFRDDHLLGGQQLPVLKPDY